MVTHLFFTVIGVDIVTAESIFGFEPLQFDKISNDQTYTTERVVLPDTSAFIHSPIQTPYYGSAKINKNRKPLSPTVSFPKYNNYVKNKTKFDKYTRVLLPLDLLGILNSNLPGKFFKPFNMLKSQNKSKQTKTTPSYFSL